MTDTNTHTGTGSTSSTNESPANHLNIADVFQEITDWRESKHQHKETTIPDALWRKIILLGQKHGGTKIRSLFGISGKQYDKRTRQFCSSLSKGADKQAIRFCEVKNPISASTPTPPQPAYKPNEIPHANNVTVVEFCRSDGQIMKIHTTTHNLNTIIHTFFEGQTHAKYPAAS